MAEKSQEYEYAESERARQTNAVIASGSLKKVIVAGPGTGKTHLFKMALKGKSNALTLTFINALIDDLSLELCGLSEVKTLHGFARSQLSKALSEEIKIFPKLPQVINEDYEILNGDEIDFNTIFHKLENVNAEIAFYKKRKDYYDKYYGYADVIYGAVKLFELKPERIPSYELVVVDEFQDFNLLEVSLIELLAKKNPILIAGDDDQALYAFKHAHPRHIRDKHTDSSSDYEAFSLSYCSRCTRVIVDATNDIVQSAASNGLLNGRIPKAYLYYEDEEKDLLSEKYPNLNYVQYFDKQIPWFIEREIGKIASDLKENFSVLIISPTNTQLKGVVRGLKKKGLKKISFAEKASGATPSSLDGFKLLLQNANSNLGWRVVAKHFLPDESFRNAISRSEEKGTKPFHSLLDKQVKAQIRQTLKVLRQFVKGEDVDTNEFREALMHLNIVDLEVLKNHLSRQLEKDEQHKANPAIKNIPITATTVQGSKGLAADYVFLTHFDEQYYIKDTVSKKISDQDVCSLLVALTRARKKVFLISSRQEEPIFLKWINNERIERI